MNDDKTTIEDLKKVMRQFVEERDWRQFHKPKDLAIAISGEAAELLEHFRFRDEKMMNEYLSEKDNRLEIERETADILSFLIRFADEMDIDLARALEEKMQHNTKRFPIGKASGKGWMEIKRMERKK